MTFLQRVSKNLSVFLKPEASILTKEEILYSEFYAKNMCFSYKNLNSFDDYQKPIDRLLREHFNKVLFSSNSECIQETFERFKNHKIMDGVELTLFYSKSDVCLQTDVFEKKLKQAIEEHEMNPFLCEILPELHGTAD